MTTSTTARPTSTDSTGPIAMGARPTRTRSRPLTPPRLSTPPPSAELDLREAETVMGWIDGMAIGFLGFADEHEAAHAAWVAYRTMSRRFAREGGRRPLPIDTEPLALARSGEVELILAAGRPIATLVRPGPNSRSGQDSFGFELQMPLPADELTVRSTAYLVYRTLRRSGIRWAMWAPEARDAPSKAATAGAATADVTASDVTASDVTASDVTAAGERRTEPASVTHALARRRIGEADAAAQRDDASGFLGTLLVILAMLAVVILPAITVSTVLPLLGAAAGLIALAALASLVHLVASDVRDSLRGRRGPEHQASRGSSRDAARDDDRLPTASRVAA